MLKAYERCAVLGTIDPIALAVGSANTGVVDVSLWEKIVFLVKVGVLGASGTVNFLVKGDTASGGAFATTVTGKTITALTQAGSDSAKQVWVEVDANVLSVQGFRYVRGTITTAVATSPVDVTVLGFGCSYPNANQYNVASVKEIV
jgi:hypothetical protein